MFERIERDPFEGKSIIKGTCIPVHQILELLAKSLSVKDVLKKYPELTEEDVREAVKYASYILDKGTEINENCIATIEKLVSDFDDALKVVSELINNSENPKNVLISTYTEKYTTVSMKKSIAVKLLLRIEGKEFDLKRFVETLENVKNKLREFWVDFDEGYIEIIFDLNYIQAK